MDYNIQLLSYSKSSNYNVRFYIKKSLSYDLVPVALIFLLFFTSRNIKIKKCLKLEVEFWGKSFVGATLGKILWGFTPLYAITP